MQLKMGSEFALIVLAFLSIIFVGRVWSVGLALGQSSYALDISNDPMGTDDIQDLIGAGLVPSSYYDKTCQEETNNTNHVNLTS